MSSSWHELLWEEGRRAALGGTGTDALTSEWKVQPDQTSAALVPLPAEWEVWLEMNKLPFSRMSRLVMELPN